MSGPERAHPPKEFLSQGEQRRFEALQEVRKDGPELGDLKPMGPRTWRSRVPVLESFETWRLRAAQFPHIERSDEDPNFFLRGVTCHPRLSDFPTCKEVISEYFRCRDEHPYLHPFNICAPMKEQMSACINEVFVRNSHRVSKRTGATLDKLVESRHEKRMARMLVSATDIKEKREKFTD